MKSLWRSFERDEVFPREAIEYVRKEYIESPKARQIMECYVFNCGNLHQTTTSRNEGLHAAYRSNAIIIITLTESYKLRRIHKQQWMQRLHSSAAISRNRIPLDIQQIPELRDLVRKISTFALTEIKQQIILAKKEEVEGIIRIWEHGCECHIFHRYDLPCYHTVPTNGTPIALEIIAPFWRLDNWDEGIFRLYALLI
jgi:hypothetical protein